MVIYPILVMLYVYDTPQQVIDACNRLGIAESVAGCAVPKGTSCEVHVVRPGLGRVAADLQVIGHEFWHCPFPDFHETPGA